MFHKAILCHSSFKPAFVDSTPALLKNLADVRLVHKDKGISDKKDCADDMTVGLTITSRKFPVPTHTLAMPASLSLRINFLGFYTLTLEPNLFKGC